LSGAGGATGADQQGPEATAFNDDGERGASSIQTQITTLTGFAWIFGCVGSGDGITAFATDPGQTKRFDTGPVGSRGAGSTEQKATAGLENQGWTAVGALSRMSHVLAAFAP
jgi:hypothetical protein